MTLMRRILAPLVAASLVACAAETSSPPVAERFEVVRGGAQSGRLGAPLDTLVVVRLLDDRGDPIIGAPVTWTVLTGGGRVDSAAGTTTIDGLAIARWTLGIEAPTQRLQVLHGDGMKLEIEATASVFIAKSIAVGYRFACGLDPVGDAWCWGRIGQYPSAQFGARPVRVDSGHAFVGIVAGNYHACAWSALTTHCWGQAAMTGRGSTTSEYAPPAPPQGGHSFTHLSAGEVGTCGIDTNGQTWCWGSNNDGGLGGPPATWYKGLVPVPVPIEQQGATFTRVSVGYSHSCALEADGTAWCWGRDHYGKLGDSTFISGTTGDARKLTTDVRFRELATGDFTTCGVTLSGALACWGQTFFNGLPGETGSAPRSLPAVNTGAIRMTWSNGAYLQRGRPYIWGEYDVNDYAPPGMRVWGQPAELPGGASGLVQLAVNFQAVCGLRADGVVLCWGHVPGVVGAYGTEATGTPVGIPGPISTLVTE